MIIQLSKPIARDPITSLEIGSIHIDIPGRTVTAYFTNGDVQPEQASGEGGKGQ